jgi:hypothetical protein
MDRLRQRGVGARRRAVDAPPVDASITCDSLGTFDAPHTLVGFDTADLEETARLTPNELTMYFTGKFGVDPTLDIYTATRATRSDPFGAPTKVSVSSASDNDLHPTISPDNFTLLFESTRTGYFRLYVATRASTLAGFSTPALVANVSSGANEHDAHPFLNADGSELWFASNRAGGLGDWDIYRSTSTDSGFDTPVDQTALSSSDYDQLPVLSADGLTVYIGSSRAGGIIWSSALSGATAGRSGRLNRRRRWTRLRLLQITTSARPVEVGSVRGRPPGRTPRASSKQRAVVGASGLAVVFSGTARHRRISGVTGGTSRRGCIERSG